MTENKEDMQKQEHRDFSIDGASLVFHMSELDTAEFAQKTAALIPSLLDVYPVVTLDLSAVKVINHEFSDVFFGMISGEHLLDGKVVYLIHDHYFEAIHPVIQEAVKKAMPVSMGGTAPVH
jgi:hypothetical protein